MKGMNKMYKIASARSGRLMILVIAILCITATVLTPFGVISAFADVTVGGSAEASDGVTASSAAYDETKSGTDEIRAQIAALRESVNAYAALQEELQAKLEANAGKIEAVLDNKALLDEQIRTMTDELAEYDRIVAEYDKMIAAKETEIAEKQAQYDVKYAALAERLRQSHEEGLPGFLEIFFYSETVMDMLTSIERTDDIRTQEKAIMDELEAEKKILGEELEVLEGYRAEQRAVVDELNARRSVLNAKINESILYLDSLEGDSDRYGYYLNRIEANLQLVNGEIDRAVEEYYECLEEMGETAFFKKKEYKLNVLSDTIKEKMEKGEIQLGSEYYADGEEYIYPVPMDYYSLSYYTGRFGYRTYYDGSKYITGNHVGIDIGVPYNTDIVAAKSGTVIAADYESGYGYYITLQHEDGTQTRYAHQTMNLVEAGEYVLQGETIAKAGSTGDATGNCCHFEIRIDGSPVDPSGLLRMPAQ